MIHFGEADGKIHRLQSSHLYKLLQKHQNSLPEDAVMILDPGTLVDRYKLWRKHLPSVTPYYAVKCNDDHLIVKTLAALGVGFDCASEREIRQVCNLGVNPERIIFANPTKQESHIRVADELNVSKMTFDTVEELYKIKEHYPKAELVIRLRYESKNSLRNLGLKFGVEFGDAVALLMKALRLNLAVVGLSFHLGSDLKDVETFSHAIQSAKVFFEVAKEVGHDFKWLDIGGGFPGTFDDYENNPAPLLREFGIAIEDALDKYFCGEMNVNVIAEPGRYFATPTCTLVTRIHSIRTLEDGHTMYFINDGVYGSLNCVYRRNTILAPSCLKDFEENETHDCSIWGPTCDSADKLFTGIQFSKLSIGDRIVFWNAGAYTLTAGGTFNGFPMPRVIHVVTPELASALKKLLSLEDFESIDDIGGGEINESRLNSANRFVLDLLGSLPIIKKNTKL